MRDDVSLAHHLSFDLSLCYVAPRHPDVRLVFEGFSVGLDDCPLFVAEIDPLRLIVVFLTQIIL